MTATPDTGPAGPARIRISVDAMGGDAGPSVVVGGLAKFAAKVADVDYVLHGPSGVLMPLVDRRRSLAGRVEIVDVGEVVTMEDKPGHVMRHGKGTSMWATLDTLREGRAAAAVSCGTTGALMALSMIRLRKLPGVNRPAIAIRWPSRNPQGFNVMLDVGADVRADAQDLVQYALMGASYARNGMALTRPRVGLLNVGVEEHKGRAELKEAYDLVARVADQGGFDFVGFVEGGDIPGSVCDVIVTDGFTGNVALKTGEGTASLIRDFLKDAFRATPLSRIAALLAITSLRRLTKRIDPRRVNGGVFLGLNGTVVKSHGSADVTGVSAAVKLAWRLAQSGFTERLAARLAQAGPAGQDASGDTTAGSGAAQ